MACVAITMDLLLCDLHIIILHVVNENRKFKNIIRLILDSM